MYLILPVLSMCMILTVYQLCTWKVIDTFTDLKQTWYLLCTVLYTYLLGTWYSTLHLPGTYQVSTGLYCLLWIATKIFIYYQNYVESSISDWGNAGVTWKSNVCVCVCVPTHSKIKSIWRCCNYVHLLNSVYNKCAKDSFLMISHFWLGTPQVLRSWIKHNFI